MDKCKDCKYFKPYEKYYSFEEYKKDFGECKCKKFQYTEVIDQEEITDDMLLYWDYESYSAGFEVGKNFGCIHFEGDK